MRKSQATVKAQEERTRKLIEKYYGKRDLSLTWRDIDPEYALQLEQAAELMKKRLIVKGVF